MQVYLDGMRLRRTLAQSPAFDAWRGVEIAPGSEAQSNYAISEAIRAFAETLYHPIGTCKIGENVLAVEGAQLRMRRIERSVGGRCLHHA